MKIKLLILTLVGLSVFTTLTPVTVHAEKLCQVVYNGNKRELQTLKTLRLMTYNVENLFLHVGKFERTSAFEMNQKTDAHDKPEEEVRAIGGVIREENPDVIVLQEVESVEAMDNLNQKFLGGQYRTMMIPGNDTRGINIGFLIKSDLDLQAKLETHKDIMWMDPVDKKEIPLFSRDLPALILTKNGSDKPVMIVLGNHAKSKRDRPGDPESLIIRTAQFQGIAKIVQDYQQKYGAQIPTVLTGDFNTDVQHGSELRPLQGLMSDSFDLVEKNVTDRDRVTHTFHPERGGTVADQMDSVMVNGVLSNSVQDVHVYRYKDANGKVKALPDSYQEREQNPSDHFPVVVDFSTEPLLKQAM